MRRILCLGDDPEMLRVRKLTLQTAGYSVLTADTRATEIDFLQVSRVDAVVLNYNMDEKAVEIIGEIRKRQREVPLLLLDAAPRHPLEQCILEELLVEELSRLLRRAQKRSPFRHAVADLIEDFKGRGSRKLGRAA